MEKLSYDDGQMADKIVDLLNQLIEADKETNKRIDRVWKFLRMKQEKENKEEK